MDIPSMVKELIYADPFYGHISLGINKSESDQIPTACAVVNQGSINPEIWFNPDYCENTLNEQQRIGSLQHELMHICLGHLTMLGEFPDRELFNIAADMCINQYIPKDWTHETWIHLNSFPPLQPPEFKDTRFYYNFLEQEGNKSEQLQQLAQYMKGGGETICSHSLWDEIPEEIRDLVEKQIEHQMKTTYENSLDRNAGNVPGYLRQKFEDMYKKVEPVVDWKAVLRNFNSLSQRVNIRKSKRKLNVRYPDNAASKIKLKNKVLVAIDTSGSVRNEEISMFFDQIDFMVKSGTAVDVVECDARIGRVYPYTTKDKAIAGLTGGGGTSFAPILEFLQKSKEHNAAIFCTDGYPCDKPSSNYNKRVLWVITPNGTTNFPFNGPKVQMKLPN